MALVVADRVQETTPTTGTGTYTLAGAKDGFQSFAAVGDGNTTYYACTDGTDYEVGIGTYTASGTTLARTTIIESSNSDAAVSWSAGDKDIFVTLPASKAVIEDASNNVAIGNNITVGGTVDGVDIAANIPSSLGTAGQVLTVNSGATAGEWASLPSASLAKQEFTATSGQTVFTITGGITDADNVSVYVNGVKLFSTDVTISASANTVTLGSGATTGDLVTVTEITGTSGGGGGSGAGVTTYTNLTAINAVSSPSEGDLAYDLAADQLYIRTTSAWKRIALGVDETPIIITEPATTHDLNTDGSTSTVTMLASDPEGFGITYGIAYPNATNALPNQLSSATTINQTTGVFTFTPSTNTSHEGNTKVRLSASDGISSTTRLVTLALLFPLNGGDRGLHFHGGGVNNIDYFSIATAANAADFGDKTNTVGLSAACSNGTRAVRGGGGWVNTIEYVTVSTLGNAASFGILVGTSLGTHASVSNGTLGFFAGGAEGGSSAIRDSIQYITIATTGNAADGGDITVARWRIAGAANTTHALFAGGRTSSADSNVIDKFTMGTSANATDFGDFVGTGQWSSGSADTTRAIWKNGHSTSVTDALQYSTIDTAGNSTDFGDITTARARTANCSDLTYAVISGGDNSGNTMDYVTIQTTGNATDFGDLTAASSGGSSTSGASS